MKKLFGVDDLFEQLKEVGLTNPSFSGFQLNMLKKYVKTLLHISDASNIQKVINQLNKNNKISNHSLKIMIFLHMIIQQRQCQDIAILQEICQKEINSILQLQRQRYDKMHNRKSSALNRQSSLDKTMNWFKQKLSLSKGKQAVKQKTSSHRTQTRQTSYDRNLSSRTQNEIQKTPKNEQVKNTQQLLISKIIIPYSLFLLKILSLQYDTWRFSRCMQKQYVWKIINLLKAIIKIAQSFTQLLRYYLKDFQYIIVSMVQIIDCEIKTFLPLLQSFIQTKNRQIMKHIAQILKIQSDKEKIPKLRQVSQNFNFKQLREFISQFCQIKESLQTFYRGNLIFQIIYVLKIKFPPLLNKKIQIQTILFQIQKQIEKHALSHKRAQSRSRSRNNESFQSQTKISSLKQRLDSVKKLKNRNEVRTNNLLVPQKRIQKISPKNSDNITTFRKLRLNMTNNIQNTQTKR